MKPKITPMIEVHTTDDEPKKGAKTRDPTISNTINTNPEVKTVRYILDFETILADSYKRLPENNTLLNVPN